MDARPEIVLELRRTTAGRPHVEPVSTGISFARGVVADPKTIAVTDPDGRPLPYQVATLSTWPDGSIRWALVDFLVNAEGRPDACVHVRIRRDIDGGFTPHASITVEDTDDALRVDTGAAFFTVSRDVFAPFTSARVSRANGSPVARSHITFEDRNRVILSPRLETLAVAQHGPVRLTLTGRGEFLPARGPALCRFAARLSFFAGMGLVRLEFTLHNPRRAKHPGGLWDLGDPGSILFRALSIGIKSTPSAPSELAWRTALDEVEQTRSAGRIEIYQASSGGENWTSRNHIDWTGKVPLQFRGCRIDDGGRATVIARATPVVSHIMPGMRLDATFTRFWQQFPSALEGSPDELRVSLFPRQFEQPFELQGGEQKTHTVFFQCNPRIGEGEPIPDLAWVHDPLVPSLSPQYFADCEAFPYLVPALEDPHSEYVQLVQKGIEGPQSFFRKREAVDEYGWRHFGDIHADHEDLHFTGEHPIVSHYNNQYDLLHGFLIHFARTGDRRWFELASDLARHVVDIDIYHTSEDKPAYNGGLFWHTDHYTDAGRATHRGHSGDSPQARSGMPYGGGPSGEHNYTTGLLAFHYLTGDSAAAEAVRQLADWVLHMDDGSQSILGYLDPGPTGLASCTCGFSYHGPGRGAGNSINALIDAFRLTGAWRYLTKAEELIVRCIHPTDDPEKWNLLEPETRWSYLVFLEALGRYLDLKSELGARDFMFAYARASLMRYAEWMSEQETPFVTRFDRVEYPTESWPAQDIRKSCIFDYAAKYGPAALRQRMTERAEYFFLESLKGVVSFPTHACARPLAVLLARGVQRAGFRLYPPDPGMPCDNELDFGAPSCFESQKDRVRRQLKTVRGLLRLARALLRPALLRRLASRRIW